MEKEEKKTVVRNSELFGEWLKTQGKTYRDIYYYLNSNGVVKYNSILQKSGVLNQEGDNKYLGSKDFHGCDNGSRSNIEKSIDCIVGNIQEYLFCMDNLDFKTNENATSLGVMKDEDITSESLDLIHTKTGAEVEFKVSYCKTINEEYGTVRYRHRDGNFDKFMRSNKIIIIYFPYLDKVVVFDKTNFVDPEMGNKKGSVRVIAKDFIDDRGKHWDIVSIWKGLFLDYTMLKVGNSIISNKVSKIIEKRG